MKRFVLAALVALFVVACQDTPIPTNPGDDIPLARVSGASLVNVIVVLDRIYAPGGHAANQARAQQIARGFGVTPQLAYGTALFGFSASVPAGRLNALRRDPRVLYVELDGIASIPIPRKAAPKKCADNPDGPGCGGGEEEVAPSGQITPWGITRVGGPGSTTDNTPTAWIIDTGIDLNHSDLNVDVAQSVNFVTRGRDRPDDGNGHGTHVAGTVAALNNSIDVVGVAPGATLVAVRVLDNSGSGFWSWVTAGVDYVAANGAAGDVANLSLGGGHNQALHDAVFFAADTSGIKFSIAAGNSGANASNYEPAHVNHANIYTVSAIDVGNCMPYWSNYGYDVPVDYAAPGVGILSTKKGGGTTTFSGTSMAAPHMAGILLLGPATSDGTALCDPAAPPDPIAHR